MAGGTPTLAEIATEKLRNDILVGDLKPAQKLDLRSLKARYGLGASPIREALARLQSEGLVVSESQRGFWVAPISAADLRDLLRLRSVIESAALRHSIEHGDEAWEIGVIGAFHRLQKVARLFEERPAGWQEEWEQRHRAFHRALIAACDSPRMIEQCDKLYAETLRYRQAFLGFDFVLDEILEEHRRMMQVAVDRDADRAVAMHDAHMALTTDLNETLLVPMATPRILAAE